MNEHLTHESDKRKNLLFQKVGIFVDAENIELSSLKHHDGRTDYKKIIDKVGDREILRILYYKPVYKEISQTFQEFWKRLGGEIKQPAKNADSFLIIDAVTMAEKLDVAIIVGGDKDYLPLVWYLKSRGCRVEIWSWPESTSPEVREAADVYFPLTKDFVIPIEVAKEPGSRSRAADSSAERSAAKAKSDTPLAGPRSVANTAAETGGAKPVSSGRSGRATTTGRGATTERKPTAQKATVEQVSTADTKSATGSEAQESAAVSAADEAATGVAGSRRGGRRRGKRGGAKRRGRGGGTGGTPPAPPTSLT